MEIEVRERRGRRDREEERHRWSEEGERGGGHR